MGFSPEDSVPGQEAKKASAQERLNALNAEIKKATDDFEFDKLSALAEEAKALQEEIGKEASGEGVTAEQPELAESAEPTVDETAEREAQQLADNESVSTDKANADSLAEQIKSGGPLVAEAPTAESEALQVQYEGLKNDLAERQAIFDANEKTIQDMQEKLERKYNGNPNMKSESVRTYSAFFKGMGNAFRDTENGPLAIMMNTLREKRDKGESQDQGKNPIQKQMDMLQGLINDVKAYEGSPLSQENLSSLFEEKSDQVFRLLNDGIVDNDTYAQYGNVRRAEIDSMRNVDSDPEVIALKEQLAAAGIERDASLISLDTAKNAEYEARLKLAA